MSTLGLRFLELAAERMRVLNEQVLAHEGEKSEADTDALFREIHTLKGESKMVGFDAISRVAHRTEDLLLLARRENRFQDESLLKTIFDGLDLMADLIEGADAARTNAADARIETFAQAVDTIAPPPTATEPASTPTAPAEPTAKATAADDPPGSSSERRGGGAATVRVLATTLDEATRTSGEVGLLGARIAGFAKEAEQLHERLREAINPDNGTAALHDELQTVFASLQEACFATSLRHQRLRGAIESMRLTAVSTLFSTFPRAVRDLARDLGKEATVTIEGGHVGADQQVLAALADPLLHLVRNSVDHGLEPGDLREAAGKPRCGTIFLKARQAGRFIEIVVGDDGRGIDPKSIAESVVRRGLLSEADVSRMSDAELREQLFRPAFSTRATVSDVSGRGVGLDVVKSAVQTLGGSVRIESEVGQGIEFILKLPVSIAVIDALVLALPEGLYALPSAYVESVLRVDPADIERSGGVDTIRQGDDARIPAMDLAQVLGFGEPTWPGTPARYVVLADNQRRLALRVPRFVGELSLVQETLTRFFRGLRIVSGTAMLEGGRRVVLLNVVELFDLMREGALGSSRAEPESPAAATTSAPRILLVEDSDLTRTMLALTLEARGFRVDEAVNGSEALLAMERHAPALVVTDLEMPKLDGFALIEAMRADPRFADTPIVVLSTREATEDKQRVSAAGADVYLAKSGFSEDALFAVIDRLLETR